jgi:hypothetical protein
MQLFDLDSDPYESKPISEEENRKEYEQLFVELTAHISLSGAVPWQNPFTRAGTSRTKN